METYGDLGPLKAENERLMAENQWLRAKMSQLHDRVWKLVEKQRYFLVVSETEPYFETVYRIIRQTEIHNKTWTEDDEAVFQDRAS